MDIGKIYSEAVGRAVGDPVKATAEEEAARQLSLQQKIDWIKNLRTQEVFEELRKKIWDLEEQARQLSVTFHSHNNHQQIIKNLIEASTLRDFITQYSHYATTN